MLKKIGQFFLSFMIAIFSIEIGFRSDNSTRW